MHVTTRSTCRPLTALLLASLLASAGLAAVATAPPAAALSEPRTTFPDVPEDNPHHEAIGLIAEAGITGGAVDGTYRPRLDVRRDQMATFLARGLDLPPAQPDFPDVPEDSPHRTTIGAVELAGITGGFADGTFRPAAAITRGQMATFLTRALDLPDGSARFPDVDPDDVHAPAIAAVASAGIAAGFPDGDYRPNSTVKRDQMATFLARGLELPREPELIDPPCPGTDERRSLEFANPQQFGTTGTTPAADRDSEDLTEATEGDDLERDAGTATFGTADAHDPDVDRRVLGPAVPGDAFLVTSALRTSTGDLEVHSQDLAGSRGLRVDADAEITATTTIPQGRRTWATAQLGDHVYVGQWGVASGSANLFRYGADDDGDDQAGTLAIGDRAATRVATVPTGNEFWALAADTERDRLWAGTRAHADGTFRSSVGMGNGREDGRHVVHRIDPSTGTVTNVLVCLPDPPGSSGGLRPDVKQLAHVGGTVYVGLGQQSGGARVYAFEPGDRTEVPREDVRDLTPFNVVAQTGVFAMRATEDWLVFGTQAPSDREPRLIAIDRATEEVRANVALLDGTLVDAIAIDGDRVAATVRSGDVVELTLPSSGVVRSATRTTAPAGPITRYVEFTDDGLRGVTNRGVVWTRDARSGDEELVDLVERGAPTDGGLPHALHVGDGIVAVGSNGALTLRSQDDPDGPRKLPVSGEAKALATAPGGTTFAATYPTARLWRAGIDDEDATEVGRWSVEFARPADLVHDGRSDRLAVIAREDNAPRSEPRTAPQANFTFRPSRLFTFDAAATSTTVEGGTALRRPTGGADEVPIEASELLPGDEPEGDEVYVGDTLGGVQRVDAVTGERAWYRAADAADRDRRVVGLHLAAEGLVVVSSGQLPASGSEPDYDPRTVVRVLDPQTGAVRDRQVISTSWAVPQAVVTGDLVVMPSRTVTRYYDRGEERMLGNAGHPRNDSFGGPYLALDRTACRFYGFEETPSVLVRFAPTFGECDLRVGEPDA